VPVAGVARRLIVALDTSAFDEAARLVKLLSPHVGWFKVGSVLFTRHGPAVCRLVKEADAKLFLDLKFHDIPNTVHGAVTSALELQADMLTLHTAGGEAMLKAAVQARRNSKKPDVLMVGVTVLTHLGFDEFHSLFATRRSPHDTVVALTELARRTGLDGVVASAREVEAIKQRTGSDFIVVTPGIRLADATRDDQTRVVTPRDALHNGADYLVVGRPIIAAMDPAGACQKILENMSS